MSSIGGPPNLGPSRNPLRKQGSISSLEQSLNMVNLPPTIATVTIYPGPGARHANMAKADLELVQRLQHLRGSSAVPSEAEMAERLAKLKGLPADYYTKPSSSGLILDTDRRSDTAKAHDLLTQVMEEAALESRVPNSDQELASRLTQLRGCPTEDTPPSAGATAPPPQQQQVPLLESPGLPHGLDDMDEVAKLLQEASASASVEASSALAALQSDPALRAAVAQSVKEKKGKKVGPRDRRRRSSSFSSSTEEEERLSSSSGEETKRKVTKVKRMGKSSEKTAGNIEKLTAEDEDEVSRIVDMYSRRAADKKKRRLLKKKGVATTTMKGKCEAKDSQTDSSSELSESDLQNSTSEKLSDTSD